MSGYLQRMATAAKPGRRVHPFVRPLYEAASEPVSQPVERITERVRESAPAMTQTREELNGPTHRNQDATDGAQEERRASVPTGRRGSEETRRGRFEALLPEVLQETSAGSAHPRFRDDAIRSEGPEAQMRDRRLDDQVAEETRRFEPLVRAGRETDESTQPNRDRKADASEIPSLVPRAHESQSRKDEMSRVGGMRSSAELAAGRRRARQQAIARTEQRSDEIQIHIGRIEVTAMPPAAPRPVATPVRKSQTLDEYLRQRNGRAG